MCFAHACSSGSCFCLFFLVCAMAVVTFFISETKCFLGHGLRKSTDRECIFRRFLVSQMIVSPRDNHVRLICQHDHARAAGTIARNWIGIESLPSPPDELREKVLFAVDNHDVGWCRSDATPKWDKMTKLPYSFFGITADKAMEIWAEGIDFCASYHPFSGYVVSIHFSSLAEGGRRSALRLEVSKSVERVHSF